jgi:hypothetical protein
MRAPQTDRAHFAIPNCVSQTIKNSSNRSVGPKAWLCITIINNPGQDVQVRRPLQRNAMFCDIDFAILILSFSGSKTIMN